MKPTIGRIVHFSLHAEHAKAINKRRTDARSSGITTQASGAVVHVGNDAREGDVYPAMIVRTWGEREDSPVQLQVFLDGSDTYWATSVPHGDQPGTWSWPPRA
jgi:hypothetical protein